MENLSDFKPLKKVELPGIGTINCSGLILIVGPNSSGKTLLLRDLHRAMKGESVKPVVAKAVEIQKPDYLPFMNCLEREGYIEAFSDGAGVKNYRPRKTYAGSGENAPVVTADNTAAWHKSREVEKPGVTVISQWWNYVGRFLVTALFLDRRLSAANAVGIIDIDTQPIQQDLHALYINDGATKALYDEILKSFGKAMWPDMSRGNNLSLKVAAGHQIPTASDRLSPTKMAAYRSIESEGDGLKSYVAIAIALLLGRRPVCLIDEPEMCLHPPQAYNLGRFIGHTGSSSEAVTFATTHSSHVLRGVLTAGRGVQIIRLVLDDGGFTAHFVEPALLAAALKKPAVRAETILDGIFSNAVVILEADTDRTVYQGVWETFEGSSRIDIHFSAVGGASGIADPCCLYRALNIPVAVIADIDVLVDVHQLGRILESLVGRSISAPLIKRASDIAQALKKIPPSISPDEVRSNLENIISAPMEWLKEDDARVKNALRGVTQAIDRMRRLKRGGVSALESPLRESVKSIIGDLAKCGLFLVPVGELEQWFGPDEVQISREHKAAWANAAAEYVRTTSKTSGGIWDFMAAIVQFLKKSRSMPEIGT